MTSTIHETMHKEHRDWESEISMWRDDIAVWQKELAETEKDLAALKAAFEARAETYCQHAAAIRMLEQDSDSHEHALAVFEMGRDGRDLLKFAKQHDTEHGVECEHRRLHEKIKQDHHALLAKWKTFVKVFVPELGRKAT